MTALPGPEWTDDDPRPSSSLGAVSHQFTHFALTLHVVRRSSAEGEGFWQETAAIADAGLPTLYRRAAELALAMSGRPSANHSTRLEVGEATP